eukprot:SAG11_NODE_14584_length_606_cov_94.424063_1_plen_63_part_10
MILMGTLATLHRWARSWRRALLRGDRHAHSTHVALFAFIPSHTFPPTLGFLHKRTLTSYTLPL